MLQMMPFSIPSPKIMSWLPTFPPMFMPTMPKTPLADGVYQLAQLLPATTATDTGRTKSSVFSTLDVTAPLHQLMVQSSANVIWKVK